MISKQINENIITGMSGILWGDAWANHIENASEDGRKRCQNLSGCKIEEVMPDIPSKAKQRAFALADDYRTANAGLGVVELIVRAYRAGSDFDESTTDEELLNDIDDNLSYQIRFGECLAWMAMGAGVSWFDDNEEFPLKIPHVENYDLEIWAVENCEDCK